MTRPAPRIAKNLPKPVKRLREGMSSKHLRLIRQLPSVMSGIVGQTEAHHLLKTGEHGIGRKSSDRWALPVTATEHRAIHAAGNDEVWLAARGIDGRALAKALWAATGDIEAMRRVVFRSRQDAALKLRQLETA